jgi:hypothetical protein
MVREFNLKKKKEINNLFYLKLRLIERLDRNGVAHKVEFYSRLYNSRKVSLT